jgi:hypothetical protein
VAMPNRMQVSPRRDLASPRQSDTGTHRSGRVKIYKRVKMEESMLNGVVLRNFY